MRIVVLVAATCLLAAACQAPPRRAAPAANATAAPPARTAREAEPGPRRLRYFDVKDFPLRNGILIVRGSREQIREVEEHLRGLRQVLREAGPVLVVEKPLAPVEDASVQTVMIHSVADIVTHMPTVQRIGPTETHTDSPQDQLLALLHEELGPEDAAAATIRFQGEQTLVVKAPRAIQDRIGGILDGLRSRLER